MATENLFSTNRKPSLTSSQMLENMINRKAAQKQNMMALTEARKLSETTPDFTATMEAANLEADNKLKRSAALETAQYNQGSKNIARKQLQMRTNLTMEGMEFVRTKVLGEIIYESYWLDEPVKEATVEQISESIGKMLTYIEEKCDSSKVEESKQSKLLANMDKVIEGIVKEAVDRLITEAQQANDAFTEFGLTEDEEEKLDEKLSDLGKDEIIEIIKAKVAQVVQDEKEKGKERAEMFSEIDQATQQGDGEEGEEPTTGEEEEPLTSAEESTLAGIYNGEIALEGANWSTLKIYFSDLRKRASRYCKEANKLYKQGKYAEAEKKYAECKDIFKDIKDRLVDIEDSAGSVIISYFLSYFTPFVAFVDAINTRCGASNIDIQDAHRDAGGTWNVTRQYVIGNVNRMIKWCDNQINLCKKNEKEEKTGKSKEYKYSLESALKATPTGNTYTPSERYISSILESGAPFNVFEDPSWGEFKNYVSMMCKKIRYTIMAQGYAASVALMDEFESRLSNVPENIPGDVKEFVMTMVGMIYGAVPVDEVIISRMGGSMGSPDTKSAFQSVNLATMSWIDILVNIRTNLSSIKDYCISKANCGVTSETDKSLSDQPVVVKNTLESMIATNKNRALNRNMGGSIFEALMLANLSGTAKMVTESNVPVSDDDVEDAALIETLLQYTILETLDTLGIYKFRLADVNAIKKDCMSAITEGNTPVYGDTDKETVSRGNDNSGKKVVRINTQKMKRRTMKPSSEE